MTLAEYTKLKNRVEQLQADAARAEGSLAQIMTQLENEFGVSSLKEAEALLAKLTEESVSAERKAAKALRLFEEKWNGKLNGEAT